MTSLEKIQELARQRGNLFGMITTGVIHVVLIGAVILSDSGDGQSKPKPQPRERIIEAAIVPIQAGSAEGTRETGPAYKRDPSQPRPRPTRTKSRSYREGPSRRTLPAGAMIAPARRTAPVDDGPDDATQAPPDWGSQTGVMAPPGAKPSDDRKGAGGTADKGALDPCYTQHAAVVASYKSQIAKKIPRFKRPAFVSAEVARNLVTYVRIHIGGAGKIARASVAKSSGNPRFDGEAVAHVKAVGSFPAPHRCVMYDKQKTRFRATISVLVRVRSSR